MCRTVFSPREENGCSAKTARIIKTGAKTGLDYKGSTGGKNTLMKLENKWKINFAEEQHRKSEKLPSPHNIKLSSGHCPFGFFVVLSFRLFVSLFVFVLSFCHPARMSKGSHKAEKSQFVSEL